ncbi:MAG: 4Fe-4S binding protein [Anaerolineales bacterium]|nr:4Fe-4S binding protein [Anaerolineales bacterium]
MAREIRLEIRTENCQVCRHCLAAEICKVRAIMRLDLDEPPYIDIERCYDCCLCVFACPYEAIALKSPIVPANYEIEA